MIADRGQDEHQICVDCGAHVCPARDPAFLGRNGILCGECAIRRGGRYDVERDVWDVVPDAPDLDEDLH
jgi:hypothetical protein